MRCYACSGRERNCIECGHAFKGSKARCRACEYLALDPADRVAKKRRAANARRARELAAEIAGPVPRSVYVKIMQSGACVYCGAPAEHVDHIHPLFRGGFEHEDNLVPACRSCNSSKGRKLLTEWDPARVAHGVAHSDKVAVVLLLTIWADAA